MAACSEGSMVLARTIALVFVVASLAADAQAQSRAREPNPCPDGARMRTSPSGPYCEPRTCEHPGLCLDGSMCRDQGLCVRVVASATDGRSAGDRVALRTCDGDEDCPTGVRCEVEQRCVPRALSGCRCSVAPVETRLRSPATVIALVAMTALLVSIRRVASRRP